MSRAVTLAIAACMLLAMAGEAWPRQSTASIRRLLQAQGFTASLAPVLEIRRIGAIPMKRGRLDIYYVAHFERHGTHHATQHVVVIQNGQTYLGSYLVDDAPTGIVGRDVLFNVPRADGDRLKFDEHGPPTSGVLDGHPIDLLK